MSAPEPPRNPRPGARRRANAPARVVALAGVAGLLLVGIVSLLLIVGAAGNDDENTPVAESTATATPKPTATATPKPTPVPLTTAQKEERRAAAEVVKSRGFTVVRMRDYDPRKTLGVLI